MLTDQLRERRIREALRRTPRGVGRAIVRHGVQHAAEAKSLTTPEANVCVELAAAAATTSGGFELPLQMLQSRFRALMSDEAFADIVLVAGGRRLPCHRAILASSSSYFRIMFAGGWREQAQAEVHLELDEPCTADDLECAIGFCYSGCVHIEPGRASAMLRLACYLDVPTLEQLCCGILLRDAATPLALLRLLGSAEATSSLKLRSACVGVLARQLSALVSPPPTPGGANGNEVSRGPVASDSTVRAAASLPFDCMRDLISAAVALPVGAAPRPLALRLALAWADAQPRANEKRERGSRCRLGGKAESRLASPRRPLQQLSDPLAEAPAADAAQPCSLEHHESLLPLIDWREVPPGELIDLLTSRPWLTSSRRLAALLSDAQTFHTSNAQKHNKPQHSKPLQLLPPLPVTQGGGRTPRTVARDENTAPAAAPATPTAGAPSQSSRRRPIRRAQRPARRPLQNAAIETRAEPLPVQAPASAPPPEAPPPESEPCSAPAEVVTLTQPATPLASPPPPTPAVPKRPPPTRTVGARRIQTMWRGVLARRLYRARRIQMLAERGRAVREARLKQRELRAAVEMQAAWRGRRDRFRGSAADVVELRGIRRELACVLAPDSGLAGMYARMRAEASVSLQAAARGLIGRRRAAEARALLPAPSPAPSDPWVCPLRLCSRRGCKCVDAGPKGDGSGRRGSTVRRMSVQPQSLVCAAVGVCEEQ